MSENVKREKPVKLGKDGKPKKSLGAKIKSLFGELKKVSWPQFSKVLTKTGTVLVVAAVFLVILMAMDIGLKELYELLVKEL